MARELGLDRDKDPAKAPAALVEGKASQEGGMEPTPYPSKDGDGQDLPGTRHREDKPSPRLGPMGFPQRFGLFPPIFYEKTAVSVTPYLALFSAKRQIEGRSPQILISWRCSSCFANFAHHKSRCEEEDAADAAGSVPLPSCSLCPFVCLLPRHLEH